MILDFQKTTLEIDTKRAKGEIRVTNQEII